MRFCRVRVTLGEVLLAGEGPTIARILLGALGDAPAAPAPDGWSEAPDAWPDAQRSLARWLDGAPGAPALPVSIAGTDFQRRVWAAAAEIPYGETRSYGDVARALGAPGAARAVGAALHQNPLPIVVPCHRVVGAGDALVGFSAGLGWKRALLALERRAAGRQTLLPW